MGIATRESTQSTQLFVQQAGDGPPLLLIHGLMVSGEMYRDALPGLSARHHVIVPDLRGHGRSGALPGPYDVAQLAQDLAHTLDDLGIETADVLGYSQGGAVAQQFARDFPGRTRKLVLACTYAYNMLSTREKMEGMLLPWIVRAVGLKRLGGLIGNAGGGPPMPPEKVRWLQTMIGANDTGRMLEAIEAMKTFDSRTWLGEIRAPTLVVAGSDDSGVPMAHAQMLVQGIPGAQLCVVDDAGHTLIWTHSAEFVRLVEGFLGAEKPAS